MGMYEDDTNDRLITELEGSVAILTDLLDEAGTRYMEPKGRGIGRRTWRLPELTDGQRKRLLDTLSALVSPLSPVIDEAESIHSDVAAFQRLNK
jgi:hypothetical protein